MSAILYGLNSTAERNSRTDWSAYLRGGLGKMTNSASIDFVRRNDYHLVLGAGTEYGFENGLALRGEYIHYDTDAAFVGVSALYRFGRDESAIEEPVSQLARAEPASVPAPPVEQAPPVVIAPQAVDSDGDGINDEFDDCADSAPGKPVNAFGCDMFDGVMEGVNFESASASLTPQAKAILDVAADTLRAYPAIRVAVMAHTDNAGDAFSNMQLSKLRVLSVVRYLIRRGVTADRLRAMAYGESRPIASNQTAEGRAKNRRVEFRTLD